MGSRPLPLLSWFDPHAGHCEDHDTLINTNEQLSPEDLATLVNQNDHNCQHENLTVLLHRLALDQIDAFAGVHQANSFTILKTTAGAHEHEEETHPPANETEETDVDQTVSSTCNGQDETEKLARACEWLTHCFFGTDICTQLRALVSQSTETLEWLCVEGGDDATITLYCSQLTCEETVALFLAWTQSSNRSANSDDIEKADG